METEAEIGVAATDQGAPGATGSLEPSEGAQHCQHLDFRLLDSRIMRRYISVVLSRQIHGNLTALGNSYSAEHSDSVWMFQV